MSKKKVWIVTAKGDRPLRAVAKDLSRKGFRVKTVLNETGNIIGFADENSIDDLRKTDDVAAIEPDTSIKLPPPESEVM